MLDATAFGASAAGHVRVSVTVADDELREACARIAAFLEACERMLASRQDGLRPVIFGHVGDGNLHYNVSQPVDMDREGFLAKGQEITAAIYALVTDMGGSISAEHGIGVLKKEQLLRYRSAEEIALMRTLKTALDPGNTLNPGKVI